MSLSAAFYCVGEIMGEHGSQIMSFMSELALLSVKTYRTNSAVSSLAFPELVAYLSSLSFSAFTPFKPSGRLSHPQAGLSLIRPRKISPSTCGMH